MMTDFKDEYYFGYVPEREKDNDFIDWKAYHTILNVVLTYSTMESRMARFLSKWELFPSAFNLMVILARTDGQGMHLSRISQLLAVSRANVTGLVDVLARKGLVQRVSSPTDRRVRLALLTDRGSELIQEILPQYYQFNAGLCKDISESDFETMVSTLTHIRKTIDRECRDEEKSLPDPV